MNKYFKIKEILSIINKKTKDYNKEEEKEVFGKNLFADFDTLNQL